MRKSTIALIGILLFAASVKAQVSEKEYKVLKAIYEKMGGVNWKNAQGWDFSKPASEVKGFNRDDQSGWFGLVVRKGKIERIKLNGNNLTGELPSELYDLDRLAYLNLAKNKITGQISPKIGQMTGLTFLDLGSNQLSGSIPSEFCNIGVNGYTKATTESKKGTELFIGISKNRLSGSLPASIVGMPLWAKPNGGIKIELYGNQLTGKVPAGIEKINNLVVLRLEGNQFEGNVPQILESAQ